MSLCRFTFEADGVRIEGEGVVAITGAPPADTASVITAFLDNLDPETIERQALDRQGWGSGTLTAEVIAVMREIAEGKVPASR